MSSRWWTYQKERFPLASHVPLIAVFSYSALSYSSLLRREATVPGLVPASVAFLTALLVFLQLRIADEFKDFEEDSRYRPYRPVPRGLVRLPELRAVFVAAALVQACLALWLHPQLLYLLLAVWAYLALMSREFYLRTWLKAHPVTYLWTHMLIMPLVDFYVTGCDWMAKDAAPPSGLQWFFIISFFNGIVLELGRKIRAPGDEETGVDTYSALWGRRTAATVWLGAMCFAALFAIVAATLIGFALPILVVTCSMLAVAALCAFSFVRNPGTNSARRLESLSGIWTLLMYLSLGLAPRLMR